MRFKLDPELVRLIAAITAAIQVLGATLAAAHTIPSTPVLIIVAVGSALQAALATYSQGHATPSNEPSVPSVEAETVPDAEQPPATYARGAAAVPVELPAAERVER